MRRLAVVIVKMDAKSIMRDALETERCCRRSSEPLRNREKRATGTRVHIET